MCFNDRIYQANIFNHIGNIIYRSLELLQLWRQLFSMFQWNQSFGKDIFSGLLLSQLVFLFIYFSFEGFFAFSALSLAFQLFTWKHCLQVSGLKMRSFTWNRFPVKKICLSISCSTLLWKVLTWIQSYWVRFLHTNQNWPSRPWRKVFWILFQQLKT